jgi:hypothetical protein
VRRVLVVLGAISVALAACDGLLGIEDVSPPKGADGADAALPVDPSSPADAAGPDAIGVPYDAAPFDAAFSDAPLLGDVLPEATPCELVNPASCGGPPKGCIYLDDADVGCATVGASVTTCSLDSDCAPGFFCLTSLGAGAPNTCVRWCRYGVPSDCDAGASCTPVSPTPTVDGTSYGYCS